MLDPWIVDVKGGPEQTPFEISVLRTSNGSGKRSYGWFGENKLLISSGGGPCRDSVAEHVWFKLMQVAIATADYLNATEGVIHSPSTKIATTKNDLDAARYRLLRRSLLARRAVGAGGGPINISVHLTRDFILAGTQYMTAEQHEAEAKVLDEELDKVLKENRQ